MTNRPRFIYAHHRDAIANLTAVLDGANRRRDQARAAVVAEHGEHFFVRSMAELWALVDMNDPTTARVLPYLHWESYAAALEAMLWWQRRPRDQSRRFITMVNRQLRAMGYVEQDRATA